MLTALASLLVVAPPGDIEKVALADRPALFDYLDQARTLGTSLIVDVDTASEELAGRPVTRTRILLAELGAGPECRHRQHRIEITRAKDEPPRLDPVSVLVGTDCCALREQSCPRFGVDLLVHYHRALTGRDGKVIAAMIGPELFVTREVREDGRIARADHRLKASELADGKGIEHLPAIDPLRMRLQCDVPKDRDFWCEAGAPGWQVRFRFRHDRLGPELAEIQVKGD